MAKIHNLKIRNFKGIKELDHTFNLTNFICFVGRGDTCKTTVLEAIEYALYPNWIASINDNDFFNCDTSVPIEIEVTLRNLDDNLLRENKYGLHIRSLGNDGVTISNEIQDEQEKLLTILFKVEKDLEPKWFVTSHRPHQEDVRIDTADRSSFNVFLLSDYLDKHFSWSKGTPLYSLLKQDGSVSDNSLLLEAIRDLKTNVDTIGFGHLDSVIDKVKNSTLKFGVNIDKTKTSIDIKDLVIKDSKVILHDDLVPLRLKGKGSKRLISVAIQTELAKEGILLIDEIEQGLEPDRVKHLVRTLCCNTSEQTFITTHSQQVVEELEPENIFILNNTSGIVTINQTNKDESDRYKSLFRACPEALYANRVIVCEGKTEIGFCRAIDKQRTLLKLPSMTTRDVVYTVGEGGDGFNKKAKILKDLGKEVCLFCDSDKDDEICVPSKVEMKALGIDIFDCEVGNNLEKQISKDLPWDGIKELCNYVVAEKSPNEDFPLYFKRLTTFDWDSTDTPENRKLFSDTATKYSWFKRIDRGEVLGDVCIKYKDQLAEGSKLKELISGLNTWIGI
jgi:predicted ATP-dependent endonuclease of OLD family